MYRYRYADMHSPESSILTTQMYDDMIHDDDMMENDDIPVAFAIMNCSK